MIFGNSEREQHRIKLALIFLVVGVLLMLWSWGSWIYRTSTRAGAAPIEVREAVEPPVDPVKAVHVAPMVLLGVALAVLTFLVASYVFVRASRRYRLGLGRRPNAPTNTNDVWSMHKLKSFDDSDA